MVWEIESGVGFLEEKKIGGVWGSVEWGRRWFDGANETMETLTGR
jgi:hypothetical protein